MKIIPASEEFGWPTLPIDKALLLTLVERTVQPGNQYGFGDKVPVNADSSYVRDHPVDCSGYVRWLVNRSTRAECLIPDGSAVQHDWVRETGFKKSSSDSCFKNDGVVRIVFLSPSAGGGIGHVALVLDGETMESHGGTGPDQRPWTGKGWQGRSSVYVLGR